MPTLTMLINAEGRAWPATSADRRLLRQKLSTRAGIPYRGGPPRVEYLVSFAAAAGMTLVFRPTDRPSPSPATSPASRRNGRHSR